MAFPNIPAFPDLSFTHLLQLKDLFKNIFTFIKMTPRESLLIISLALCLQTAVLTQNPLSSAVMRSLGASERLRETSQFGLLVGIQRLAVLRLGMGSG